MAAKVRAAFNTPENCERLRQAAECGDEAAVLFLTVRGADVNYREAEHGSTPLYVAARQGHDAVVRALLDAGADKDLMKNNGGTPLHVAAAMGHDAVVRALLDAGADKTATCNGRMARDVATKTEIKHMLS